MTHLDPKALEAAEAAHGKTCGGLLEGRPMANAVLAYLAALPQAEPPKGWKLVPVEPTEAWLGSFNVNLHGVGAHLADCRCAECSIRAALQSAPIFASPTPAVSREDVIEWCADEIEVLQQSLVGACNRSFNDGDQGSAIISRFQADGIKAAAALLREKAAALSSEPHHG